MLPYLVYTDGDRFWKEIRTPEPWIDGVVCLAFAVLAIALCSQLPSGMPFPEIWPHFRCIGLDLILAFPLVRALRGMRISFANYFIRKQNNPSLLDLPDEILLEVCEWLAAVERRGPSLRSTRFARTRTRHLKQALANLSQTNHKMREFTAPLLLSALHVEHDSWLMLDRSLKVFGTSVDLRHSTKALSIAMQSTSLDLNGWLPRKQPERLTNHMLAFSHLERLDLALSTTHRQLESFKDAFDDLDFILPTVRTLAIGPCLERMVVKCPNVENIISTAHIYTSHQESPRLESLVEAASRAPKLVHLECSNDMIELHSIQRWIPHLTSYGTMIGGYDRFDKSLAALSGFQFLRKLAMADVADLDMGYDPPRCGNFILDMTNHERELFWAALALKRTQALESTAHEAFNSVKSLEEILIGEWDRAIVTRGRSGSVSSIAWSHE